MSLPADQLDSDRQHEPTENGGQITVQNEDLDISQDVHRRKRPISYWTLLADPQMAVLCFLRIAGQLGTLSLLVGAKSYLFYQLRYLSPTASDEDLAFQAGLLVGAKTLAKVCTGVLWGVISDAHGRKMVLLVGLIGSIIGNVGYGFSTTFTAAIVWQVVQGIASNEITLTRTIAAELYADADSTDRSRALLLPLLVSSIGMILGPILGGFTTRRTRLGALSKHPYSFPNLIVGIWYAISAILVLIFVQESMRYDRKGAKSSRNGVTKSLQRLLSRFSRGDGNTDYQEVPQEESVPLEVQHESNQTATISDDTQGQWRPRFREIWTAEVIAVMVAHFIITGHISTFGTVYTIFISTPIDAIAQNPAQDNGPSPSPFLIRGGLGLTPPQVGTFLTSATVLFAVLQGLVFPRLVHRFGTVRLWRFVLLGFPILYVLAPLPNLLTSDSQMSILSWTSIAIIMVLFMTAQALVMPPMIIFISECVPHPATRGRVNAVGATVGNLARTVFPMLVMFVYGIGLKHGLLIGPFWMLSGLAGVAIFSSRWVGNGLDETTVLKRSADAVE